MSKYRVFLGAPSKADLQKDSVSHHWQTISSKSTRTTPSESFILPAVTLEAVSRRISLIYQNIIFDEAEEGYAEDNGDNGDIAHDQTTMITWPPTPLDDRPDTTAPSFLMVSKSHIASQFETQETQETQSYNYSDASSIARFPTFHFNLNSLTSISSFSKSGAKSSKKINVLLAALEVEGPDAIRIKKGVDAGKEISVLKMILGDEEGAVCKLTAWREIAETWGGSGKATAVKRGDVILIENVTASCDASTSTSLSASPYLNSKLEICYRTMPYTHEDNRLRPDLRLGVSDPSVRKVATVVRWFSEMAGLSADPYR